MKFTKAQFLALGLFLVLLVSIPIGVYLSQKRQETRSKAAEPTPTPTASLNMANPASVYCTQHDGQLEIRTEASGGQTGYCKFADGSECEEWAYYRNECTPGSVIPIACNNVCYSNSDCGTGYCYQPPMRECPTGLACPQVMPAAVCRNSACSQATDCLCVEPTCVPRPPCLDGIEQPNGIVQYCTFTLEPGGSFCPKTTPTPTPLSSHPQAVCLTLPQSDNFDTGPNPGSLWNGWSNNGVVTVGGTLNANVSSGNGYAGVITKNKTCGDFDVRVDFSGFTTSGQTEADVRLSVVEYVGSTTVNPKSIIIEKYSTDSGQGFRTERVSGEVTDAVVPVASTATSGKLRIRRVGSTFTTYYDVGNGWQTLGVFTNGFTDDVQPALIVKSFNQNPSVSANFDNFNLTAAILDPSITAVPPTPTFTPVPTPVSGRDQYLIDVGDKQSLVITVGAAIAPQIKFKAKLASLRSFPDMYLRLHVKDELAFLDNPNSTASAVACNNPALPDRDFYIPVRATDGVYSPVQQISASASSGATVATVTSDGWVMLDGVVPGRYYTLYLKGPKTRKSKMVEHLNLQPNQTSSQDFDWTATSLDPGDLPDPNNGGNQDCTINSTDWSLVMSRIGANKDNPADSEALSVADVNYDGIVNAGDSVAILDTLSKRPDDDR